jgi:hypothetical protein
MKSSALAPIAVAILLSGCGFSGASAGGGPEADAGLDAGEADAPGEETLVFRRGDGATVQDTWLFESEPDEERGDLATMVIDSIFSEGGGNNGESIGALRFDFIGEDPARVPQGSTIEAAELVLVVENLGSDRGGDPAELFPSLVEWDESTTWTSMGSEPGVDPDTDYEDRVVGVIGNSVDAEAGTEIAIDARPAVGEWVSGVAENRGWILRMPEENTNGVRLFTSDAPAIESRPRLTVTFRRP